MLDPLEVAAEPNRRRLLQLLAGGERTVTDLAGDFPVSRSAISQHLLLLEQVGLVSARKEGRNRFYAVNPDGMAELRLKGGVRSPAPRRGGANEHLWKRSGAAT